MSEKHPLHRKLPDLHTSDDVQRAVERQEARTDESVPNDPSERIEAYMARLERVFLHPDPPTRERNLDMFRDKIYDALIIKRENFPESYFTLQQRIARERGQAVEEIPLDVRERMIATVIEDQKHSLDAIINYLASNDATYPPWFKYYAWTQLIKLSQFDKERGEFKKRTASTVAPFPTLHQGPLAAIADLYERVKDDPHDSDARKEFDKKFPTLYAERIAQSLAETVENREEIKGTWITYHQGDPAAAEKLFQSLSGRGTGWCTADGRTTAETQIESGDFHVYYTNDAAGNPVQPRLAIRMESTNRIGEVRGILPRQGVEPMFQAVLDTKLNEFGKEADAYRQKSADMRRLTALDHKHENNDPLTPDDLRFLYEIDHTIHGFGYGDDPRVKELRATRNVDEDMLVIFDCTKDDIAHVPSQITEHTKAYVGQLEPGIFQKMPSTLEHVYTKFPEGRIQRTAIEIGGKTAAELIALLEQHGNRINNYARAMLLRKEFTTTPSSESLTLITLTVHDLGFPRGASTDDIYRRAQDLGLDLAPAEAGPHLRLQYTDQPMDEWVRIGMQPIPGPDGRPFVFNVERLADGSWLYDSWARPGSHWDPDDRFAFRRKQHIENSR